MNKKVPTENGIATFSGSEFFREGEHCYIHMSSAFPEFVGVPHKHKFIEIVYVISGSAEHITTEHRQDMGGTLKPNERRYGVEKGDLVIINCETTHAFYANSNDEPFVCYDLMFTCDFLDPSLFSGTMFESLSSSLLFYSLFPDEEILGPDLRLSGAGYAEFGELFSKIYLEYTAGDTGYMNMIRAYVIELVVMILRRMNSQQMKLMPRQEELIGTALEYLGEHYKAADISLGELASRVFLNKDYLGRLFKDVTGMTFGAYLQQHRINEARRLLDETDMKISDVSLECGYNDTKNFYRSFRRITGMTPGEYRRSQNSVQDTEKEGE
nr:helix-turn-helix domain-containing protein [Clostridia bacterium]